MDPVTTALVGQVSSGLKAVADEAVLDAYKSIKSVIKIKLCNHRPGELRPR